MIIASTQLHAASQNAIKRGYWTNFGWVGREADDDYVVTIKPADCQRHIKKDTYEKGDGAGATTKKKNIKRGRWGGPMHLGR